MAENHEKHFHWQEGNKFGLEAAKSLFFIGNASVAALLTYAVKAGEVNWKIPVAIGLFLFGSICAILMMFCGYLANLNYGNSSVSGAIAERNWAVGKKWNIASYLFCLAAMTLILIAVLLSCWAILGPDGQQNLNLPLNGRPMLL